MSDWVKDMLDLSAIGMISTVGEGSQVLDMINAAGIGSVTSGGSTGANIAIYLPVIVRSPCTVYQMGWGNGTAVSGNVDAGIYDKYGNRLVSAGSTAQAGTSTMQTVDVTDTPLQPALYYLALVLDNGTGLIMRPLFAAAQNLRSVGALQQGSAFPLPSTATFAAISTAANPALIYASISPSGLL